MWLFQNLPSPAAQSQGASVLTGFKSKFSGKRPARVSGCVPVKGCVGAMVASDGPFFCLPLPCLPTLGMGLGDLGFLHAKSSSGTQFQGIMGRRQMTNRKLVSKNVVLSNIFYNKKQLLIIYIYIFPPMGPDCTEIFFFKAAATRGISFLLYQSSDSVTSSGVMSWWAGHPWSGGWQWGWGTEGVPTLVSVQC